MYVLGSHSENVRCCQLILSENVRCCHFIPSKNMQCYCFILSNNMRCYHLLPHENMLCCQHILCKNMRCYHLRFSENVRFCHIHICSEIFSLGQTLYTLLCDRCCPVYGAWCLVMSSVLRIVNETSTWHNPPHLGPRLLLNFSCLFYKIYVKHPRCTLDGYNGNNSNLF